MNQNLFRYASYAMQKILPHLDVWVSRILIYVGIFPSRKGYCLFKDAILFRVACRPNASANTLYQILSEWHGCTPKTPESNMRSALKTAHDLGTLIKLNKILCINIISSSDSVLTNLHFISLIEQHCRYYIITLQAAQQNEVCEQLAWEFED
ncbi:MAG: sporulation initiation factor Spo0A C-terminal domain-containing protein [Firmicutes bacterium]|nr:sporulation initiation factor Spo0A C-terminal domain-containing protein [Bacillota bacterium]